MPKMNESLPESLVDDQVSTGGYSSLSEYIRELIRKEEDRQHLRRLLLEGAESPPAVIADEKYFAELREQVLNAKPEGRTRS